jgi:hypothetical protein
MRCKGLGLCDDFFEAFDAILMETTVYDRANSSRASLGNGRKVGGPPWIRDTRALYKELFSKMVLGNLSNKHVSCVTRLSQLCLVLSPL